MKIGFELAGLSDADSFIPIVLYDAFDSVMRDPFLDVVQPFAMFLDERFIDGWAVDRLDKLELHIADPRDSDQELERFSNRFVVDLQVLERLFGESEYHPRPDFEVLHPSFHSFFQISGDPGNLIDFSVLIERAKFF